MSKDGHDTIEGRSSEEQRAVQDEMRARLAAKFLWHLVATAKGQSVADFVAWRDNGGQEAEDFLYALDTGGSHPLLAKWEAMKAGPAANRPAPGLQERNARRFLVLLCIALERAGMSKNAAREHIAEALKRKGKLIGLPVPPESAAGIRYYERNLAPPLTPQDHAVIETALKRCGKDHARLTRHFLGLVEFALKPLPTDSRWR